MLPEFRIGIPRWNPLFPSSQISKLEFPITIGLLRLQKCTQIADFLLLPHALLPFEMYRRHLQGEDLHGETIDRPNQVQELQGRVHESVALD
ncbi:unnamed protein product [Ectocarpus sp. CCAP 1310/34]|nr:unnamed protein product [Ectocarpus sp. CCAP 1310/34]